MMTTPEDKKYYLSVLASEECQCGKSKRKGTAFCYMCYTSLSQDTKIDLYKEIGKGFEEAYEEGYAEING